MRVTIDFETRSACDLRACGEWVYAEHPTTDALCLAVKAGDAPTQIWVPDWISKRMNPTGLPVISQDQVLALIWEAQTIEAHNASFEQAIWQRVLAERYGWPPIPARKWRCSAAKAAAFALPRSLEGAGRALQLPVQKDLTGKKVMQKLCKPRRPRKGEDKEKIYWHEDPADFLVLFKYCIQDVESEHAISKALPDLSLNEQQVWHLDQKINGRGVQVDVEVARRIIDTVQKHEEQLLAEVDWITNGKVQSVKQVGAMTEYCHLEGLTKSHVAKALEQEQPEDVRRLLEIRQSLGKASVAKFQAMVNRAGRDGRIRGSLLYHGASTGRWAGRGCQPQNFPRAGVKEDYQGLALDLFCEGDLDGIDTLFGDPMGLAQALLRPMFIAAPGCDLVCADFSSIEARVLLWLAEDEEGLNLFRSGADIYCDMAEAVYGYPVTKANKFERQVGKTCVLGLGYGMGSRKFFETCRSQGIEIDKKLARKAVATYRKKYAKVRTLWFAVERSAVQAVLTGEQVACGRVKFGVRGHFLHGRLPSGRLLAYPFPAIKVEPAYLYPTVDEDGEEGTIMIVTGEGSAIAKQKAYKRAADEEVKIVGDPIEKEKSILSFMSVVQGQWLREPTYSGKLVENIDQATSRDLMAEAMLRLEAAGYPVILSVHDEVIAEVPEGFGSVEEFEAIMSETPSWAAGCPVAAEGWRGKRYRK